MANVKISELPAKTTLDGGEEIVIAANGSNNKVSMNTIKQFTNEGTSFDPDGNYPNLHAGIANQIYTEENTISTGEWNFRTTAGDVSVPSEGTGSIVSIKGKSVRTANRVNANFNIICSEGIYVTRFNKYKYISAQGNIDQTVTFNLVDGNWDVDLESMGIFAIYDGVLDGTIVVEQTAEDPGYLTTVSPRSLMATGVNQIGTPSWLKLDNATISDGQIVAGDNYIYAVRAYGGVTNGYMVRDNYSSGIITVGRCQDRPDFGTTITQDNIQGDAFEMRMSFENTGWFVVEDINRFDEYSGNLSIHPRWSNQEQYNTDQYSSSYVYLPLNDKNYNQLPNAQLGMPSLGNVADEYDFTTKTYIQRIEVSSLDYSLLASLYDNGTAFDYDSNYVYYVKESPTIYQLDNDVNVTYTANDYGTEWILDENGLIPYQLEIVTSYGTNLVDKLRTGVLTKDQLPQIITQLEYNNLSESKNSDGVIRFIYTADKPDNFAMFNQSFSSDRIGTTTIVSVCYDLSPIDSYEMSVTSSDDAVITITGTPYIDQNSYVVCEMSFVGVGTCDITATIGGVSRSSTWEIYS